MTILSTAFNAATLRANVALFLEAALARMAGQPAIGVVTVPAPVAPLSVFLSALPRDMSFAWHNPPSGMDCAGAGAAVTIQVSGPDRLAQLREASDRLWGEVEVVQHPVAPAYAPRLTGGLAFAAGGSRSAPWRDFGDGAFSLARWTYGRVAGRAFLSLAVRAAEQVDEAARRQALDECEALLDRLAAAAAVHAAAEEELPAVDAALDQMSPDDWEAHIRKVHDALAGGHMLKIVAARRCDVTLAADAADLDVFDRLSTEPRCTAFAFRRERSAFVGASPELLFLKTGAALRTQALAGTARSPRQDPHPEGLSAELLGSSKDRSEHEYVVRAIREALVPLCTQVSVAREPEVLALRNIIHINTPFVAHVRDTTHVADLLGALHPTPAVGGVPGPAARAWIVEHERHERGWYTGPVGWFDNRGNAEFAVAIRCGVVGGRQAHLYTGAGVVADSHHAAEYAETALKQLPMLRALGVRPV